MRAALLPAREPRGALERRRLHEGPGHRRRRLHRLARRRQAARRAAITPRIFDLSASPYHSPLEVETFTGAITDPANLDLAMRDCDAVIHLAAVADVGHVLADPVLAEEVNTRGTLNVLEAACRAEVGRVVYGSTIWVYSDCAEQEVDEETPIPAPAPPLHRDQARRRDLLRRLRRALRPRVHVLRFGIPYGPRARAAGVVAKFTDLALRRQGADDRRRRQPDAAASSTSRTSPTASSPRSRPRPPAAPTTSPATRS